MQADEITKADTALHLRIEDFTTPGLSTKMPKQASANGIVRWQDRVPSFGIYSSPTSLWTLDGRRGDGEWQWEESIDALESGTKSGANVSRPRARS
jgi:hypothetical protein